MTTMLLRWHNHFSHHGFDKRIERSPSLLLRLCPDDETTRSLIEPIMICLARKARPASVQVWIPNIATSWSLEEQEEQQCCFQLRGYAQGAMRQLNSAWCPRSNMNVKKTSACRLFSSHTPHHSSLPATGGYTTSNHIQPSNIVISLY